MGLRMTGLIAIGIILFGCSMKCKEQGLSVGNDDAGVVYYETFKKGSVLPIEPIKKIERHEALNRETYCIGYYSDDHQLTAVEKYLQNELFFRFEYEYYENGTLRMVTSENEKGEVRYKEYDRDGNLIDSK